MKPEPGEVLLFHSAAELRTWLVDHHQSARYAWIGFHKKSSGLAGMTYTEAVDEALCFGWIDGQLSGLDESRYALRFTPRRVKSVWSAPNVKRVGELIRAGRMHPAGLAAFEARKPEMTGIYLADLDPDNLPRFLLDALQANEPAWVFWSHQPPSYRLQMMSWVLSAKRDETRRRRLAALIEEHAAGRRIDPVHLPKLSQR